MHLVQPVYFIKIGQSQDVIDTDINEKKNQSARVQHLEVGLGLESQAVIAGATVVITNGRKKDRDQKEGNIVIMTIKC